MMEFDDDLRRDMRVLAQDEKRITVGKVVAESMNETSTNPTPQAQYLASTAAKAGFEEGIVAAMSVFALMRQFTDNAQELGKAFLDELQNYLDEENPDA